MTSDLDPIELRLSRALAVAPSPEAAARLHRRVAFSMGARAGQPVPSTRTPRWRIALAGAVTATVVLVLAFAVGPRGGDQQSNVAGGPVGSPSAAPASGRPAASGEATAAPTPEATIGVPGTDGWGPSGAPVPTKGRVPDGAVVGPDGKIDRDKVPDFVGVWGRDGVSIAGYVAYRDLVAAEGSHPWWYQKPPIPVYAGDLRTLVGFMFDSKGFVPLGVDPDSVTELPTGPNPLASASP